jgi:predicted TIM-barrel fold metal-dependent hydrolase
MTDEIIREVWRAKNELAKEFNYDMEALAAELRKRQKESGRKTVNLETESAEKIATSRQ